MPLYRLNIRYAHKLICNSSCQIQRPLYTHLRTLHISSIDHSKHFNPFKKRKKSQFVDQKVLKIANRICLTVLGNGAIGQPRCLAMFTDQKNYLFNCGEGVGRLFREHDIHITTVRHVFITHKSWRNLSGVADVYLTLNAFGVRRLSLHGPPHIEDFMHMVTSHFKDAEICKKPLTDLSYVDDTMEVEYVPICISKNRYFGREKTGMNNSPTVSYICKIHEKSGDFLPEKCVEHGVPIGSLLLKLKSGEDVTLPSGKFVRSSDVHDEVYPGYVFLVVDCPNENFIEEFVNEAKFQSYQLPEDKAITVSAVFHFSPPHVVKSAKYQQWINGFHQDVYHFILNSDNPTGSSETIHQVQQVLHQLHPRIFGLLQETHNAGSFGKNETTIPARTFQQLHLRPVKKLDSSNVVEFSPEKCIVNLMDLPEFQNLHAKLRDSMDTVKMEDNYPEIVFLGTGSTTSSAYRNVSAILVNTSETNSVLLDCGEGTFNQLVKFFGYEMVWSALQKISCIFISHQHTDHYMGLFEVIKARKQSFEESKNHYQPPVVVLPPQIETKMKIFNEIFEPIKSDIRIFSCGSLTSGSNKQHDFLKAWKNFELSTVPVKHCADAYGAILTSGSKWKIVYSGDTAPCQRLVDEGKDCTVLIHEASIEDGFLNEASSKLHSTPSQVLDISKQMNAKYTIMTHFSKRYLAIPVIEECDHWHMGYAFDFMRVRLCDLPLLPHFLPILKSFFSDLLEQHSEKTLNVVSFERNFLKVLKSQQ